MDRNELTFAIAGALIAAFVLGWAMRWAFSRLNTAGPRNAARAAELAGRLHAAEDALHRAEEELGESGRRTLELEADLVGARKALARSEAQAEEMRAAWRRATIEGEPPANAG